jgi:Thioredoxin-like
MYPHERSLVKRLAGKPFVLLGVNSDKKRDEVKKVVAKEEMTWRSWWDGGGAAGPISTAYNVSGWPTIYVLDPKGAIRHIDVRDKELDEAVDKLLAEMEKEKKEPALANPRIGPGPLRRKYGPDNW